MLIKEMYALKGLPDIDIIARARKELGLTQTQLAELSGVSQSTIAKIERGKLDPTYSTVRTIFYALYREYFKEKCAIDICQKDVYTVDPDDDIEKAYRIMQEKGYSQAPVVEGGLVIGTFTTTCYRDIHADAESPRVRAVMKPALPSVESTTPVSAVEELMNIYWRFGVPAILVYKENSLAGIITPDDLLVYKMKSIH